MSRPSERSPFALPPRIKRAEVGGTIPATDSDTSVTGWFVMALKSAQMARLDVPQQTFYERDALSRFRRHVRRQIRLYPQLAFHPAVTAEAYLCRQLLGWKQNDPRLVDACKSS